MSSWIRTRSGLRFDPVNPDPTNVRVDDIAWALSNLCRFTGHTSSFYSVGQHSVLVSQVVKELGGSKTEQLQGLLHDATEAYLVDVALPMKRQDFMRGYRETEDKLEKTIAPVFGLETLTPPIVRRADMLTLATEARDLMGNPQDWDTLRGLEPRSWFIVPMLPHEAYRAFMARFEELRFRAS